MYEESMELLGMPLLIKIVDTNQIDVYSVVAVTKDGDGHVLGSYVHTLDAVDLNKPRVIELVDEYRHQTGGGLKFLILISDGVIWIVNTFMSILTTVFGGLGGFGLIGIVVVLGVLAMMAMIWVYALMIIIPFASIAYVSKAWLTKTHEEGIRSISRNAREIGKRYILLHKTDIYTPALEMGNNPPLYSSNAPVEIVDRVNEKSWETL